MYLQLEYIRQCVKLSALKRVLSTLPKALDDTYERVLRNIESVDQLQDAIPALQWLCFSTRPLDLRELVEILAIQNGDEGGFFPDERLPDPEDIMVICSSLISCDTNKSINLPTDKSHNDDSGDVGLEQRPMTRVRLSHFSVKEYLFSDRCALQSNFQIQVCHIAMAEGCLRYLLHLSKEEPLTEEIVYQFPLARYAAEYWWQHAQKINSISDCEVLALASKLLLSENSTLVSWIQLYNIDTPWRKETDLTLTISDIPRPLYYAVSIGVPEIIGNVSQQNVDVNARGGMWSNALMVASIFGYEKVVQILADAGANVNSSQPIDGIYDSDPTSALNAAVYYSDFKPSKNMVGVVQVLLGAGANFNTRSAALHNAVRYPEMLELLLKTNVDIDMRGYYSSTPLQHAANIGCDISVKMLLDVGANPNTLETTSMKGHQVIAQMLLDAGARLQEANGQWSSALSLACRHGHKDIVLTLLSVGTDVNGQGGPYGNALQAASTYNQEAVVQALLEAGADANAQGGYLGSALQAASSDSELWISLVGNPLDRKKPKRKIEP